MKLTYWVADCWNVRRYSIRCRTKKEVVLTVAVAELCHKFNKPRKVIIEYTDAFDLMSQAAQIELCGIGHSHLVTLD